MIRRSCSLFCLGIMIVASVTAGCSTTNSSSDDRSESASATPSIAAQGTASESSTEEAGASSPTPDPRPERIEPFSAERVAALESRLRPIEAISTKSSQAAK